MSWKKFACMAALCAMAAPAAAVPSLDLVMVSGTEARVDVIITDTGSVAAEIAVTSDLVLSNPMVGSDFDTANPGNNPLTGGVTNGLFEDDLADGDLFISYGSPVLAAGTYPLLTFDVAGSGDVTAAGLLAQLGVSTTGLSDTESFGAGGLAADFNGDGSVDLLDLDILGQNFGTMGGAMMADGDANGDGDVDLLDLDILGQEFGMSTGSAVPEPTAAALCLAALGAFAARRR